VTKSVNDTLTTRSTPATIRTGSARTCAGPNTVRATAGLRMIGSFYPTGCSAQGPHRGSYPAVSPSCFIPSTTCSGVPTSG
jgi:hypothetical protein